MSNDTRHHENEHGADHAHGHHHHELPTGGRELTTLATSATLHCLTGCAIGEVTGMVIGTALGFSDLGTIALAVGLAFLFGYTLTSLPLLRAGLALGAIIPIALAADTVSIAVMEIVDNLIMVLIPGAMEAGVADILFWGALSFALFVAFLVALPVNRWLIARGKGHVALHETGIHGGPDPRVVGLVLAVAAVFGISVLAAELAAGGSDHGVDHQVAASQREEEEMNGNDGHGAGDHASGMRIELDQDAMRPRQEQTLSFRVLDRSDAVTAFDVEHARRMHLIVVRKDLTGFQHLHPEMDDGGTWSTRIEFDEPGQYRVFADFRSGGRSMTLDAALDVEGQPSYAALPPAQEHAETASGYRVRLVSPEAEPGIQNLLAFEVYKDGKPVNVEQYLGADGHLVALREGDLEYLHVHPLEREEAAASGHHHRHEHAAGSSEEAGSPEAIRFMAEFPSAGSYRLFLQFKDQGRVHTAEFTREARS